MALAPGVYLVFHLGVGRVYVDAVDGASEAEQGREGEDGVDWVGECGVWWMVSPPLSFLDNNTETSRSAEFGRCTLSRCWHSTLASPSHTTFP
jgi:hypothetical protein